MGGNAGGVTVPGRDELIAALEKDLAAVDKNLVPDDLVKRLIGSEISILNGYCNDPLIAPTLLKLIDTMLESNIRLKVESKANAEVIAGGAEVSMAALVMIMIIAYNSGQEMSQALETGVAQKLPKVFCKLAAANETDALDALEGIDERANPGSPITDAITKTIVAWEQDKKSVLDRAVATLTQNLRAAAEAQRDAFDEKQRRLKTLAPKIKIRPAR